MCEMGVVLCRVGKQRMIMMVKMELSNILKSPLVIVPCVLIGVVGDDVILFCCAGIVLLLLALFSSARMGIYQVTSVHMLLCITTQ